MGWCLRRVERMLGRESLGYVKLSEGVGFLARAPLTEPAPDFRYQERVPLDTVVARDPEEIERIVATLGIADQGAWRTTWPTWVDVAARPLVGLAPRLGASIVSHGAAEPLADALAVGYAAILARHRPVLATADLLLPTRGVRLTVVVDDSEEVGLLERRRWRTVPAADSGSGGLWARPVPHRARLHATSDGARVSYSPRVSTLPQRRSTARLSAASSRLLAEWALGEPLVARRLEWFREAPPRWTWETRGDELEAPEASAVRLADDVLLSRLYDALGEAALSVEVEHLGPIRASAPPSFENELLVEAPDLREAFGVVEDLLGRTLLRTGRNLFRSGGLQDPIDEDWTPVLRPGTTVLHGLTGVGDVEGALERLESIIATGGLLSAAARRRAGIEARGLAPQMDPAIGLDRAVATTVGFSTPIDAWMVIGIDASVIRRRAVWLSPGDTALGSDEEEVRSHYEDYAQSLGQDGFLDPPSTSARERHLERATDIFDNELFVIDRIGWEEIHTVFVRRGLLEPVRTKIESAQRAHRIPRRVRVVEFDVLPDAVAARLVELGGNPATAPLDG